MEREREREREMEMLRITRKSHLRNQQVEPADVSKVGIEFADNIAVFFLFISGHCFF